MERAEAKMAPNFARPSAIERIFGRVLMALVRIGIVRGHFYVLEVRGRRSGKIFSVPVDPLDLGGHRYLVCPRGESNWVRNARAAGEVTLIRALHRWRYRVREVPPELRASILKAYLDSFAAEVQRFFPVPKGSALALFVEIAPRYPVFELHLWE
jgi:deazaflavin-dependent oxidoreductase (nitroreductase family)